MLESQAWGSLPADFTGTVRLFPLPNLVMFPHALQPLQVFEPRYCKMLEDALQDDQLLATALLQPGWQQTYQASPSIHPVICVGRVVMHAQLEDGRYNILLSGLRRASVIRERRGEHAYRRADVALLEDLYPAAGGGHRARQRRELLGCFERWLPGSGLDHAQVQQLSGSQLPLGVLTDILSFSLGLHVSLKQRLLAEWNVDVRAAVLLERLRELSPATDPSALAGEAFPPRFSDN